MCASFFLFPCKRQKTHHSRALNGACQMTLMLCANARVARINNLRLARNITLEQIRILVIYFFCVLRAERTLFIIHTN